MRNPFRRRPRVNGWIDRDWETLQFANGVGYIVGPHGKWWRRATVDQCREYGEGY